MIELLAFALLLGLPIVLGIPVARRANRGVDQRFSAFREAMAQAGLPLGPGSTPSKWSASGSVGGVPVAIETFEMAVSSAGSSKPRSVTKTAIRIPAHAPRVAIYREPDVPITELGVMQEVAWETDTPTGFRSFAESPAEIRARLGAEARRAFAARKSIRSIDTSGGAWLMVVDGLQSNDKTIAELVELLVAIHEARAPSLPNTPTAPTLGWTDEFTGALGWSIVIGALLGIPLACAAPPVQDLATPLVCEKGNVRNTGGNRNPLRCVTPEADVEEYAHAVTVLVGFNLVYIPALLALSARAAVRTRRREEPLPRAARGPYR
jgi:hypothetical protein